MFLDRNLKTKKEDAVREREASSLEGQERFTFTSKFFHCYPLLFLHIK